MLLAGELGETLGDGRLARGRTAGDADQERSRRQDVHGGATLPFGLVVPAGRAPSARVTTTMPTWTAGPARLGPCTANTYGRPTAIADRQGGAHRMTDAPEGPGAQAERGAAGVRSGRRLWFTRRLDVEHRPRRRRRGRRVPHPAGDHRRRRRWRRRHHAGLDAGGLDHGATGTGAPGRRRLAGEVTSTTVGRVTDGGRRSSSPTPAASAARRRR